MLSLLYINLQQTPNFEFNIINLPETHDGFYSVRDSKAIELESIECGDDRRSIVHRLAWHATRIVHMLPGGFYVLGIFFVGVPWYEVGSEAYKEYIKVLQVLNRSIYIYTYTQKQIKIKF